MSKCDKDTEITDQNLRQYVGYNMKRAMLAVREDIRETLEPFGLRNTSFSTLSIIVENPGVSQSRLAETLAVERSGIVTLVDELEQAGLIERGRVAGDRRQYALRTTKEGEKIWREAERAVHAHEDALFRNLTAEERETLRDLLGRVRRE